MAKSKTPMRRKEREQAEMGTKLRVCELCGVDYTLGSRTLHKKKCDSCYKEKMSVQARAKASRLRLEEKGFSGSLTEKLSEFESSVVLKAEELLTAYVDMMKNYGMQGNATLMTLDAPELEIAEHEATNEFTPFLKQMFLNLYVKMPRQDVFILEHLGISEKRFRMDKKAYPEFGAAVDECDRKHLKLLELVSFHNAMNPKATSERIFLMKAGDPARYRESFKGDTFNMGQVNIQVNSNIKGLGIPKNTVAGDGK